MASANTIALQTPEDFRPPPRWRPPAHVPADSNLEFIYKKPLRFALGFVKTIVLLALSAGILWFALAQDSVIERVAESVLSDPKTKQAASEALAQVGVAIKQAKDVATEAAKGTDYLAAGGPEALLDLVEKRLNSPNLGITRIVVHPSHGSVEVQNPKRPGEVDRYQVSNGKVVDEVPVDASRGRVRLKQRLFARQEVSLSEIPRLIQRTQSRLAYAGGKVSHIVIEKNLPFSNDLVIRVYERGVRNSGRIDYTAKGAEFRVYR